MSGSNCGFFIFDWCQGVHCECQLYIELAGLASTVNNQSFIMRYRYKINQQNSNLSWNRDFNHNDWLICGYIIIATPLPPKLFTPRSLDVSSLLRSGPCISSKLSRSCPLFARPFFSIPHSYPLFLNSLIPSFLPLHLTQDGPPRQNKGQSPA